ncbi:MAG TPA: pyridoxal phosphate-dependent aminotransferase [Candidatus Pullichristensenella avicola]|nr:pyridoxal phosphate-dependent aminotransferase [Candidatus Pullichristensenella avicola]
MLQISRRAAQIAPSATLAIDARAKALKAEGKDVIGFGVGEPDFDTPAYVRDAAHQAIEAGKTRYTPVAGTLSLRKKIAEKFLRDNGLVYEPSEIIVSSGAKQSIYTALCALVDEGDEVLIPSPYWVSYPEMVKMAGGVPVFVPCRHEDGFRVRPEEIARRVTGRTKALLLNSPSNPNGCVLPRKTLEEIAAIAVEKGFYVISDEIYEKLVYDGCEHVSIASLGEKIKAQTVVVNGASKAYAMTGWRIGYAGGPAQIVKAMTAFQSHSSSNACSVSQYAVEAALSGGEEELADMVRAFDARRRLICRLIDETPGLAADLPEGAFYVMMDVRAALGKRCEGVTIESSHDFASLLLEKKCVAVVPGEAFGEAGFVRLSYAVGEDKIREGVRRMAEFMASLT